MPTVRYLLDTNMASYVIKGTVAPVRERLLTLPMSQVGISTVTEAELRFGVAKKPEAKHLKTVVEEFLLRIEVVPWASEAAKQYASLRAVLKREGTPMGNLDLMIAAQALATDAILVTHDQVFQRVRRLKTEDWC